MPLAGDGCIGWVSTLEVFPSNLPSREGSMLCWRDHGWFRSSSLHFDFRQNPFWKSGGEFQNPFGNRMLYPSDSRTLC